MVPGSQVIWYDAVTTSGVLEWQDTLNKHNLPFFDAADAIFINYTWKEETPQLAAAVAGARRSQVYMGVDVFGRNTFGGGGMTCDVALRAARSAGQAVLQFQDQSSVLPMPVYAMSAQHCTGYVCYATVGCACLGFSMRLVLERLQM